MFEDEGGTRHAVRVGGRRCVMYCTGTRIAVADAGDVICDIPLESVVSYFREGGRITVVYGGCPAPGKAGCDGSVTVRSESPADALRGISSAVSTFRSGREGPR